MDGENLRPDREIGGGPVLAELHAVEPGAGVWAFLRAQSYGIVREDLSQNVFDGDAGNLGFCQQGFDPRRSFLDQADIPLDLNLL